MDDVFRALADPGRRTLLDSLRETPGQNLRDLCAELDMARQSVSKHLAILEAAGLVTTVRHGREKLHYLNAAPINDIGDRWISHYDRGRVEALADLKTALEAPPMSKPTFVYTTYIRTTPAELWQALTDPAFTSRYWGLSFQTDWKPGSKMVWTNHGVVVDDPEQVVLAADPYTHLSYTWHSMTPELADAIGIDDEKQQRWEAEGRSTANFDIEDGDPFVKLTVTHETDPDGLVLSMVSGGWPIVLASLKSILETGIAPDEPLP
ncbi:ArsR/SmtB family transcription factor [Aquihabitans sp. McL0605]|uniref:ArsR/SmtB family transcription factor n=1 Tax=Aquihabitans sp. McL0605 TaxID=3415671 RepID=UPI003CE69562